MDTQRTNRKQSKKHTFKGRKDSPDRFPDSEYCLLDGEAAVRVELAGRHGDGKHYILSEEDFAAVMFQHRWWSLSSDGYVNTGAQIGDVPGQPSTSRKRTTLARLLMDAAGRNQQVTYRNGNRLDLRRSNLEVISWAEFCDRRAAAGRPAAYRSGGD